MQQGILQKSNKVKKHIKNWSNFHPFSLVELPFSSFFIHFSSFYYPFFIQCSSFLIQCSSFFIQLSSFSFNFHLFHSIFIFFGEVSTHRQPFHWQPVHWMPIHRQPNSSTALMSLLGVNSSTDIFIDSLQPDHSLLDPTVWLDGAWPANTCIPPSFPRIRNEIMLTNKFC